MPPGVRVIDSNLGFRIISYNVLAEIYATQSQYPYCPPWALSFEYRRKLLMSELQRYDADIMCLQEVQADHFNTSLYHDLLAAGYDGVFKAKTRVSMGREGRIDGCALFFRKSRFALHEKYVIEFNDAADATYNLKGKQPQLQPQREALLKRLKRDNVAQVVVLEMTTGLNGGACPSLPACFERWCGLRPHCDCARAHGFFELLQRPCRHRCVCACPTRTCRGTPSTTTSSCGRPLCS